MMAVNSSWALSNNIAGYNIINGSVDGTYDSYRMFSLQNMSTQMTKPICNLRRVVIPFKVY